MSPKVQKETFLQEMAKRKILKKRNGRSEKALQKITDNLVREGIIAPPEGMDYTHPLDLPHQEEKLHA